MKSSTCFYPCSTSRCRNGGGGGSIASEDSTTTRTAVFRRGIVTWPRRNNPRPRCEDAVRLGGRTRRVNLATEDATRIGGTAIRFRTMALVSLLTIGGVAVPMSSAHAQCGGYSRAWGGHSFGRSY